MAHLIESEIPLSELDSPLIAGNEPPVSYPSISDKIAEQQHLQQRQLSLEINSANSYNENNNNDVNNDNSSEGIIVDGFPISSAFGQWRSPYNRTDSYSNLFEEQTQIRNNVSGNISNNNHVSCFDTTSSVDEIIQTVTSNSTVLTLLPGAAKSDANATVDVTGNIATVVVTGNNENVYSNMPIMAQTMIDSNRMAVLNKERTALETVPGAENSTVDVDEEESERHLPVYSNVCDQQRSIQQNVPVVMSASTTPAINVNTRGKVTSGGTAGTFKRTAVNTADLPSMLLCDDLDLDDPVSASSVAQHQSEEKALTLKDHITSSTTTTTTTMTTMTTSKTATVAAVTIEAAVRRLSPSSVKEFTNTLNQNGHSKRFLATNNTTTNENNDNINNIPTFRGLLHDTTMIDTALDLDSLDDGSQLWLPVVPSVQQQQHNRNFEQQEGPVTTRTSSVATP